MTGGNQVVRDDDSLVLTPKATVALDMGLTTRSAYRLAKWNPVISLPFATPDIATSIAPRQIGAIIFFLSFNSCKNDKTRWGDSIDGYSKPATA